MGRFMVPCCCVCGRSPMRWHDPAWEAAGGLQDFCPTHAPHEISDALAAFSAIVWVPLIFVGAVLVILAVPFGIVAVVAGSAWLYKSHPLAAAAMGIALGAGYLLFKLLSED